MDTVVDLLSYLDDSGVHIGLIIAGSFGAILSMGNKKELNGWQKVITIMSGGATANYLTPVLGDIMNINENTIFGFAFLLGFSGLEGVKWLILKLKQRYGNDEDGDEGKQG